MKSMKNLTLLAGFLLLPAAAFCQEEEAVNNFSYFSNPLFLTLMVIIILLAVLIVAFSHAFRNIADSDYLLNKYKDENKGGDHTKTIASVALVFLSLPLLSQNNAVAAVAEDWRIGGLDQFTFYFMLVIILLELIVLALMFYQFNFLIRSTAQVAGTQKKKESKVIAALTDSVSIEEEGSIMLDHDYDGIRELDNNLPPWWKYGFYFTIVFACIYLINFHILGTGDLQGKEYEKEMARAKAEVEEFMKNSANNVDESTVKVLTDPTELATGKDLFISNCAACHGKLGEGSVGPNLTDAYWLHGGSIQDIFKSIKYGWVEKGMKSWKEDLSPVQIAQVSSFIKSLAGTNPPNPKAPQGDLFSEGTAAPADSLSLAKDSLTVMPDTTAHTK